jgi:WD40 repeat protein
LATLKPLKQLTGYVLGVTSVAFSPDGRRLAAGSGGQEAVKLWDTETWQEVLTLSGRGMFSSFLEFSPDGRYLLGNGGGYTHLWSAPTLAEIEAAEKSAPAPGP